jgi:hypothetical protein
MRIFLLILTENPLRRFPIALLSKRNGGATIRSGNPKIVCARRRPVIAKTNPCARRTPMPHQNDRYSAETTEHQSQGSSIGR